MVRRRILFHTVTLERVIYEESTKYQIRYSGRRPLKRRRSQGSEFETPLALTPRRSINPSFHGSIISMLSVGAVVYYVA
ncbi:hypothetical protein ARMGADRAFT_101075 [Armillaria gallica]|uniref:Uncharacterized protein n=1 Tax=Armillaria gallica TaxID=47427 RepID=A0A2H3CEU0_ARMGA|nr:hypothetical protein ARMGADRAFT_101075 [Armillaria gallica]